MRAKLCSAGGRYRVRHFAQAPPTALFRTSGFASFEEVLTSPNFWATLGVVLVDGSVATGRRVNKTKSACPSAAIASRTFQRRTTAIYGGGLVNSHRMAA